MPPKSATTHNGEDNDNSPKTAMEGAVVNTDVKNMPAIKLPTCGKPPTEARKPSTVPRRTKSTAPTMLALT